MKFHQKYCKTAKKRLNHLYIKNLPDFPNFGLLAFLMEKLFFDPNIWFYPNTNAKVKS